MILKTWDDNVQYDRFTCHKCSMRMDEVYVLTEDIGVCQRCFEAISPYMKKKELEK